MLCQIFRIQRLSALCITLKPWWCVFLLVRQKFSLRVFHLFIWLSIFRLIIPLFIKLFFFPLFIAKVIQFQTTHAKIPSLDFPHPSSLLFPHQSKFNSKSMSQANSEAEYWHLFQKCHPRDRKEIVQNFYA